MPGVGWLCYLPHMNKDRVKPLSGKLVFETASGAVMSESRIRLLEAIGVHGSLSRAAKEVPLSYKAAWDTMEAMNTLSESPLVVRITGGKNGGGTQLTEHGRQIVALYRAMESSQQDILNQLAAAPAQSAEAHRNNALRTLIRRLSVKTSARNQFVGTVTALDETDGMVDVHLTLVGGEDLVVAITPASVANMGLTLGVEAYALVKAPWVSVSLAMPRRSAGRNVLAGTLTALQPGKARTELTVTTPAGRMVSASVSNAVVAERGLRKGQSVWASFATDSAILATFT